jgi:uncharacterized protein
MHMPQALTYPGVYIEELSSGVHSITGVATSITAFIGKTLRGPVNEPVLVQSFAEFERTFGGLWIDSTLGYAVMQFFLNGGGDALIVRVVSLNTKSTQAKAKISGLWLIAATTGENGNNLRVTISDPSDTVPNPDPTLPDIPDPSKFKLTIDDGTGISIPPINNQTGTTIKAALAAAVVNLDPDLAAPPPPARPINAGPAQFAGGQSVTAKASLNYGGIDFEAADEGEWGNKLRLRIEQASAKADPTGTLFNLTVLDTATGVTEQFMKLSTDPKSKTFITGVLENQSSLIRINGNIPNTLPLLSAPLVPSKDIWDPKNSTSADPIKNLSSAFSSGTDGAELVGDDISNPNLALDKKGIWALEHADLFNLLCIPPLTPGNGGDIDSNTRSQAAAYCKQRRAIFIVDPLTSWAKLGDVSPGIDGATFGMDRTENTALFFPFVRYPDPFDGQIKDFAPCGTVAGVFARTDSARGVWKAPAGIEATLSGVVDLSVKLTDGENGQLNPIGVNCLRSFPVIGRVAWGSRTLVGADQLTSEWKYIPVRRLALFIEESLFRGTKWVVFEPNDEPLWSQIRLNVGSFMQTLFRQGAFQGSTPKEAYFVKCSSETTTQTDIDNGIVNIIVGFAPLKPAEFVVIKIQQISNQS